MLSFTESEQLIDSMLLETHGEFSKLRGATTGTMWVPWIPQFGAIGFWCQLYEANGRARLEAYYYLGAFFSANVAISVRSQLESELSLEGIQLTIQESPVGVHALLMYLTVDADNIDEAEIRRVFMFGHRANSVRALAKQAANANMPSSD
jgi:hypothetical protein